MDLKKLGKEIRALNQIAEPKLNVWFAVDRFETFEIGTNGCRPVKHLNSEFIRSKLEAQDPVFLRLNVLITKVKLAGIPVKGWL